MKPCWVKLIVKGIPKANPSHDFVVNMNGKIVDFYEDQVREDSYNIIPKFHYPVDS